MLSSVLLISSIGLCAAGTVPWRRVGSVSFEEFLQHSGLSAPQEPARLNEWRARFAQEKERVARHNSLTDHNDPASRWKESLNQFSVLGSQERSAFYGRNKVQQGQKLEHQEDYPANYHMIPESALPASVDWRDQGVVTSVKDQGHCGSCWAFASTAVIESHAAIASGMLFDLSPQQIAACAPNPNSCGGTGNCNGATAELAFNYAAGSKGLLESFQYPYSEYFGVESACAVPYSQPKVQVRGFIQLTANNYLELMNAVAREGPVAVSVDASTWHAYESGIFNGCNQVNPDINHAVVLMGYGEDNGQKYWLVRNSWSASWGEQGYIRLARDSANEEKNCGSDITPLDGTACAGDTTPQTVCGTCGILFDSAYPTAVTA